MDRPCLVLLAAAALAATAPAVLGAGVEEFWTDDFKAFEQIYGKTSDKDLYGDSLPPSFSYGDSSRFTQGDIAKEKNEKALELDDLFNSETKYANYGEKYLKYLAEQSIKPDDKVKSKPAFKYISYSDFKPVTKAGDPETYDYLKHLEQFEKTKFDYPQTANGFKPYSSDFDSAVAYKSIQDILDAHEANKARPNVDKNRHKYNPGKNLKGKPNKINPSYIKSNHLTLKSKCVAGACKKRAARPPPPPPPPRYAPYVRRIKHKIIQY